MKMARAEGKTVLFGYSATRCGACKHQNRVINLRRAEDPSYDATTLESDYLSIAINWMLRQEAPFKNPKFKQCHDYFIPTPNSNR